VPLLGQGRCRVSAARWAALAADFRTGGLDITVTSESISIRTGGDPIVVEDMWAVKDPTSWIGWSVTGPGGFRKARLKTRADVLAVVAMGLHLIGVAA
jgi:hypothetical protein